MVFPPAGAQHDARDLLRRRVGRQQVGEARRSAMQRGHIASGGSIVSVYGFHRGELVGIAEIAVLLVAVTYEAIAGDDLAIDEERKDRAATQLRRECAIQSVGAIT